jgi:hypothetical protein
MSPYLPQTSSGAPTYTAVSASLSLSGLDEFSPLDPNSLDAAEWYHPPATEHHDSYHLPPLSPGHDHFAATGFGPGAFASHGITVTSAEMHRKHSLSSYAISQFHHSARVPHPFFPLACLSTHAFPFPSHLPCSFTPFLSTCPAWASCARNPAWPGSYVVMTLVLAQSPIPPRTQLSRDFHPPASDSAFPLSPPL